MLLIFGNSFCSWHPVVKHTKMWALAPSSAISNHVQACLGPTDCNVEQVRRFCSPILGSLTLRTPAQYQDDGCGLLALSRVHSTCLGGIQPKLLGHRA